MRYALVVCRSSNTDYTSPEPFETLVLLILWYAVLWSGAMLWIWYHMLCHIMQCYSRKLVTWPQKSAFKLRCAASFWILLPPYRLEKKKHKQKDLEESCKSLIVSTLMEERKEDDHRVDMHCRPPKWPRFAFVK